MTETKKWPPTAALNASGLFIPMMKMAKLAMRFGMIDRTAVRHADGVTPESDTDHTVMLGWLAPALAERCSGVLDVGLVAQFALVHDAPEVLVGDTQTLRITPEERAAKERREKGATNTLARLFGATLPWFAELMLRYEQQVEREAKFVRAVDKLVVKMVHLIDGCAGIRAEGVTADEFVTMAAEQRVSLSRYGDCGVPMEGLLALHQSLCCEVEARLRELELPTGVEGNMTAMKVAFEDTGHVAYVCDKEHDDGRSCQFCDGGLFHCTRCNSFEGMTTTRCPGRRMTSAEGDAVYAGELDYRFDTGDDCTIPGRSVPVGHWVKVGSPHTPNRGWVMSGAMRWMEEAEDDV